MTPIRHAGVRSLTRATLRYLLVGGLLVGCVLSGVALGAPGDPTPSGGAEPAPPEPSTPEVARNVGVAELPLLVTEPPAGAAEPGIPPPVTGGPDSTLNPFSPLFLPQDEAQPTAPPRTEPPERAPASTSPAATPAPEAPVAPEPPRPPAAPAPPARVGTPTLSEAVIARMQPATTLRNPPAAPIGSWGAAQTSLGAAGLAAVRTPASPPSSPRAANAQPTGAALAARLAPLGFGGGDGNPTSSPSNRVGRSLGELRVTFTAMATGTGIFRVGDNPTPVLLALGDTLPGTEFVLSELTPRGAQFAQDDVRHTLSLYP